MVYRYCEDRSFEDLASGRVILHRSGYPNFPVRLAQEIFCRCLERTGGREDVCIYDPCCGGGYLLTVLGFLNYGRIGRIAASDINGEAVELARENLSLLSREGLWRRMGQLDGRDFKADIVFTDVPYGNLVEWQAGQDGASCLLDRLLPVIKSDSVVAVCSNRRQIFRSDRFHRVEKQAVGKRLFQIFVPA